MRPAGNKRNGINKTKIILADEYPLVREAVRARIEREKDLEVVAETGEGKETIDVAAKLQADILLISPNIETLDLVDTIRQVKRKSPQTVVVVSQEPSDNLNIHSLIEVGVRGFFEKGIAGDEIIHNIRKIAAGDNIFPADISDAILESKLDSSSSSTADKSTFLTKRQLEILKLIARGMSNKDIAFRLGVSLDYIKATNTVIFKKLDVSSRTEAIAKGLKFNLINYTDFENEISEG